MNRPYGCTGVVSAKSVGVDAFIDPQRVNINRMHGKSVGVGILDDPMASA